MKEIWKDIEGYEGLYQVSNLARVKSLNYNRTGKEKVLKQRISKNGYWVLHLYKCGKAQSYRVHRLIAQAFIPNPDNKPYIDHINTIRTDNKLENLRWVTCKENCNNPLSIKNYQNGGGRKFMLNRYGKQHPCSKCIIQFSKDGIYIRTWDCMSDVQRELGFKVAGISNCCKGRVNSYRGFKWKYA